MAHELRKLMAVADDHGPLSGHVEMDETWIGGKQRAEDRRQRGTNKTIVFGMVERSDGKLRAGPIPDTSMNTCLASSRATLHPARRSAPTNGALMGCWRIARTCMARSTTKPRNGYAASTTQTQSRGIGAC
jgi:hypothetical protein